LEEEYSAGDEVFEELVAAENDLIDSYVGGRLSEAERARFENRFLNTPEQREQVEFARSLMNYDVLGHRNPSRGGRSLLPFLPSLSPWRELVAGAVLVIAIVGYSWMALANWQLRQGLEQMQTRQGSLQQADDELRRQLTNLQERVAASSDQQEAEQPPGSTMIAISLASDLTRSGGKQTTLPLSSGISKVLLVLNREPDSYLTYNVVLETVDGVQIWQEKGLTAQSARNGGKVIQVEVSPNILRSNDYVLKLFGNASLGNAREAAVYSFRVVKR